MIKLTSKKIAEILDFSGEIIDCSIDNVSTDSRNVNKTSVFIAIKGEKFDGHNFIKDVINSGVALVVAEYVPDGVLKDRVIVVEDTLKAYGKIAQYNRRQYKGKVIALTGSSGKTTTKEELKAVLGSYAQTYATTANYNNFIGVPRSLLDIDMNSQFAIIEMGMSNLGEIRYLTQLAEPDIAVVTNVYPMHIEFLKTIENIALAKAEIFSGLKQNGIAIFNEDTNCSDILKREAEKFVSKIYTFGKNNHSSAKFSVEDDCEHYYYNAWCVLKVVEVLGLDADEAIKVINNFGAPEGRGKKHYLTVDNKNILLIDNSYSAGPDATLLAINSLGKLKLDGYKRKIAVIGKMAELGDFSKEAHIRVGKALYQNNIDVVIGVCEETKDILAQLDDKTDKYYFENVDGVYEFLKDKIIADGDVILVKGSHYSSQVFKVVAKLLGK